MKKMIGLIAFLLVPGVSFAAATAEPCPAQKLCPSLINQTVACAKWYSETKCDTFVETYQKLSPRYDCKRSFDTKPVPALWLCDEGVAGTPHPSEKAAALLAKLKFAKAKNFFASGEFRSTLDGEAAEHYMKKSKSAEEKKAH